MKETGLTSVRQVDGKDESKPQGGTSSFSCNGDGNNSFVCDSVTSIR